MPGLAEIADIVRNPAQAVALSYGVDAATGEGLDDFRKLFLKNEISCYNENSVEIIASEQTRIACAPISQRRSQPRSGPPRREQVSVNIWTMRFSGLQPR